MSTLLLMASARDSPTAARHSRRRRLASVRADAAAQRRLPSGSGSAMAACAHISAQLSARAAAWASEKSPRRAKGGRGRGEGFLEGRCFLEALEGF